MIVVMRMFLRIYLLTLVGVASALIARLRDRGCVKVDDRSICATKPGAYVSNRGILQAGFPPTNMPDETYPLCEVPYTVPLEWAYILFDVDDWCLKGMKGERVVCCDKSKKYEGDVVLSPYFTMNEGSTITLGGHRTTWEDAFPSTLKSFKDSKSSMNTLPPYGEAFGIDSSSPQHFQPSGDNVRLVEQTDTVVGSSNANAATADSTLNLNDVLALNSMVQPNIPENLNRQSHDIEAGTTPLLTNMNVPDLTDLEPEGDIVGV